MVGAYATYGDFCGDYGVVRGQLDEMTTALVNFQEAVGRGVGGRELSLAKTQMDQARMWLVEAHALILEHSDEQDRVAEYKALVDQGWSDHEARDIVWSRGVE